MIKKLQSLALGLAKLKNTEGATIAGILADPTETTGTLADRYGLEHRSVQRAVQKAKDAGLMVGSSGAFVPVMPGSEDDPEAAEQTSAQRLAERAAQAEAAALRHAGRTYGSRKERDVAVILRAFGLTFETGVKYTSLLPGCDRAWTADFVLTTVEDGPTIIEVTADRPGAAGVIHEKVEACRRSAVVLVVVDGSTDDLIHQIRQARKAHAAARVAAKEVRPSLDGYNMGGVFVVRIPRPQTPSSDLPGLASHGSRPPWVPESVQAYQQVLEDERLREQAKAKAVDALREAQAAYRREHPDYEVAAAATARHEEAEREVGRMAHDRVMSDFEEQQRRATIARMAQATGLFAHEIVGPPKPKLLEVPDDVPDEDAPYLYDDDDDALR